MDLNNFSDFELRMDFTLVLHVNWSEKRFKKSHILCMFRKLSSTLC